MEKGGTRNGEKELVKLKKWQILLLSSLGILVGLALTIIVPMLLGPVYGNVFSTINSSLCGPGECPPPNHYPTSLPGPTGTPPIASNNPPSLQAQLDQVDQALGQSMQSSFAYNSPTSMKLNDTATIQLLLNPSLSPGQLGSQVTESGTLNTGTLEITEQMKAELILLDPEAFVIQAVNADPIQLMSSKETAHWEWYVTAKKGGLQSLTLVIYRLIRYEGQDSWREVEAYKAHIDVNVTLAQCLESLDWQWAAGILITAIAIPPSGAGWIAGGRNLRKRRVNNHGGCLRGRRRPTNRMDSEAN